MSVQHTAQSTPKLHEAFLALRVRNHYDEKTEQYFHRLALRHAFTYMPVPLVDVKVVEADVKTNKPIAKLPHNFDGKKEMVVRNLVESFWQRYGHLLFRHRYFPERSELKRALHDYFAELLEIEAEDEVVMDIMHGSSVYGDGSAGGEVKE